MVKLVTNGLCIPHPLKAHYGGEDAHVIDDDRQLVVFSDGVGGYDKEVETQIADYSQALVTKVAEECKAGASLKKAIHSAHLAVDIPGAATICIVQKEVGSGNLVSVANLGDCRVVMFRNGEAFWSSQVMQHGFNCPMQLGHPLHHPCSDTADAAAFYQLQVQEGDVILMGTDGLWDNVWVAEMQQLLPKSSDALKDCAAQLAHLAFQHSLDETFVSPFAMEAAQHCVGFDRGGKPDDITVLVAMVIGDDDTSAKDDRSLLSTPALPICQLVDVGREHDGALEGEEMPGTDNTTGAPRAQCSETGTAVAKLTLELNSKEADEQQFTASKEGMKASSANPEMPILFKHQTATTGAPMLPGPAWQPEVVWCPTFVKGGVVLLAWVELGSAQWLACAQLPNGAYWPVSQNEQAELRWWAVGEPLPVLPSGRGPAGVQSVSESDAQGSGGGKGFKEGLKEAEGEIIPPLQNEPNTKQAASLEVQVHDMVQGADQQQQGLAASEHDAALGWDCLAQQEKDLAAWNTAVNSFTEPSSAGNKPTMGASNYADGVPPASAMAGSASENGRLTGASVITQASADVVVQSSGFCGMQGGPVSEAGNNLAADAVCSVGLEVPIQTGCEAEEGQQEMGTGTGLLVQNMQDEAFMEPENQSNHKCVVLQSELTNLSPTPIKEPQGAVGSTMLSSHVQDVQASLQPAVIACALGPPPSNGTEHAQHALSVYEVEWNLGGSELGACKDSSSMGSLLEPTLGASEVESTASHTSMESCIANESVFFHEVGEQVGAVLATHIAVLGGAKVSQLADAKMVMDEAEYDALTAATLNSPPTQNVVAPRSLEAEVVLTNARTSIVPAEDDVMLSSAAHEEQGVDTDQAEDDSLSVVLSAADVLPAAQAHITAGEVCGVDTAAAFIESSTLVLEADDVKSNVAPADCISDVADVLIQKAGVGSPDSRKLGIGAEMNSADIQPLLGIADVSWATGTTCLEHPMTPVMKVKQEAVLPARCQSPSNSIAAHWGSTDGIEVGEVCRLSPGPLCFGSWTRDEIASCILQRA